MQIISSMLGEQQRPRIACELRQEGVAAAAGVGASGTMSQVGWQPLEDGALQPSLHVGNIVDVHAVTTALKSTLDRVAGNSRDVTLIVPDNCVRVLLVEFDSLPHKYEEALPVVTFRLKKLLPFDTEHAAVSYQILSSTKKLVRVLAVAMAKEAQAEYESAVRAAGYEPGAIIPSTLATLAAIEDADTPTLLVNITGHGLTTAIVHRGELQLHRSTGFSSTVEGAARNNEIVQMVNVVSAWSEDNFGAYPGTAYAAGMYSAAELKTVFADAADFHDVLQSSQMLAEAATAHVAKNWLAGVAGALKTE